MIDIEQHRKRDGEIDFDRYNADLQKQKTKNYERAIATFEGAKSLAEVNGFILCQHSHWHFALIHPANERQIYNLYPNNQRIYIDPKNKGPFLKVPSPWTFLDVVSAAIIATQLEPIKKSLSRDEP